MKKPVVDYRAFRPSKINDPAYAHLKLLLGWVGYLMLFFLTEKLIPAQECYPVHCWLDDLIPFCEYFVIPYVGWYVLIVVSLLYFALYNPKLFKGLMSFIIVTQVAAMFIYIVFPNRQDLRPLVFERDNVLTRIVGFLYTLDTNTGDVKMLRPRNQPGEMIGHEYWLQDGIHVGYQVHVPTPGNPVRTTYTGFIKYDGTNDIMALNGPMKDPDHVHSLDKDLIVCDAGVAIKLIRREGDKFGKPRILSMHNSSFYHQNSHPHPGFTPDGKGVLYASDSEGYINVYLAEIPDFDSLPEIDE